MCVLDKIRKKKRGQGSNVYKKNGKNNRNYYAFILIREDEQGFRADEACGILKIKVETL